MDLIRSIYYGRHRKLWLLFLAVLSQLNYFGYWIAGLQVSAQRLKYIEYPDPVPLYILPMLLYPFIGWVYLWLLFYRRISSKTWHRRHRVKTAKFWILMESIGEDSYLKAAKYSS